MTDDMHRNLFIEALKVLVNIYPEKFKLDVDTIKIKSTETFFKFNLKEHIQDHVDAIFGEIGWQYELIFKGENGWGYSAWMPGNTILSSRKDIIGWPTKKEAAEAALIEVVSFIKNKPTDERVLAINNAYDVIVGLFPRNSLSSINAQVIKNIIGKTYDAGRNPEQKIPGIRASVNQKEFTERLMKAWQGVFDAYNALEDLRPGGGFE
jgi:hypothetical protein